MEHSLFVKGYILPLFAEGKDLEVRIRSNFINSIHINDTLLFNNTFRKKITSKRIYPNFVSMLLVENYKRLYPKAQSKEWLLRALRTIYCNNQEVRGVVIFELEEV